MHNVIQYGRMARTKKSIQDKKKREARAAALRSLEDLLPDEQEKKDTKKIKRDRAGRPTVMTRQVFAKLEHAIRMGSSDAEACSWAKISQDTLCRFKKANPDFADTLQEWRDDLVLQSRDVIDDAIRNKRSISDAWLYLRAKRKEEFAEQKNLNIKQGVVTAEDLELAAREGIEPDEGMLDQDVTGR